MDGRAELQEGLLQRFDVISVIGQIQTITVSKNAQHKES